MVTWVQPTAFAPAERAVADVLTTQSHYFSDLEFLRQFLDAVPEVFLVLNEQRQIVFANRAMLNFAGLSDDEPLLGLRPGEALNCVHATKSHSGCGTTEFCKTCGAANAIISSLRGEEAVQECRISLKGNIALDLRVWATPLQINDQTYSLFTVNDISHEKRRQVLERLFFHDILNTAGGLRNVTDLLQKASLDELDELRDLVYSLADQLVEEIQTQRMLAAAENNELVVRPSLANTLSFVREIADFYRNHEGAANRQIRVDPNAHDLSFTTDKTLLSRVLGSIVKNALEASDVEQIVTLGCTSDAENITFWVHNAAVIPRDVQLQIFQRSFSTKGVGRGLGTYSSKLLTERYLQGKVWFESLPESGTTFSVRYPLHLKMPDGVFLQR